MREDLFKELQDYKLTARFYECEYSFTIEELFDAFQDRAYYLKQQEHD